MFIEKTPTWIVCSALAWSWSPSRSLANASSSWASKVSSPSPSPSFAGSLNDHQHTKRIKAKSPGVEYHCMCQRSRHRNDSLLFSSKGKAIRCPSTAGSVRAIPSRCTSGLVCRRHACPCWNHLRPHMPYAQLMRSTLHLQCAVFV